MKTSLMQQIIIIMTVFFTVVIMYFTVRKLFLLSVFPFFKALIYRQTVNAAKETYKVSLKH